MRIKKLLREIPKVDELFMHHALRQAIKDYGRAFVIDTVRSVLSALRSALLSGNEIEIDENKIVLLILNALTEKSAPGLRRVINATGVILHTNLGRSCLSDEALNAVIETSAGYSTLEYNLESGMRGSRHDHLTPLLCELSGAEDAMVVNNNAAAVMLMLSAVAAGKEVVVSRGEMVEIGGSFRIPEIMALSGALLREVGTTNCTHASDYEKAVGERTGAMLKAHTSNYRVVGFTAQVRLQELAEIGRRYALPVLFDLGGGLLMPLEGVPLPDEPCVSDSVQAGADVVCFSADKLLGGPQAGILLGRRTYIEKMKNHPMARALRVDKMTLAALEATLRLYRDPHSVGQKLPTLRMLCEKSQVLQEKALRLAENLAFLGDGVQVVESCGQTGGGTSPNLDLPGAALSLSLPGISAQKLEKALRQWKVPIIARIHHNQLLLDVRTVEEEDFSHIADCLKTFTRNPGEEANQ